MHIAEGEPSPPIPQATLLFIDEMQRVPRWQRAEILSRPASFVIGSHKNHSGEFKKAKLEYTIKKLKGVTEVRLRQMIEKRIMWARRDSNLLVPSINEFTITKLIDRFGDDLWAVEDYLYDIFQDLTKMGDIEIEAGSLWQHLIWRLKIKRIYPKGKR